MSKPFSPELANAARALQLCDDALGHAEGDDMMVLMLANMCVRRYGVLSNTKVMVCGAEAGKQAFLSFLETTYDQGRDDIDALKALEKLWQGDAP